MSPFGRLCHVNTRFLFSFSTVEDMLNTKTAREWAGKF